MPQIQRGEEGGPEMRKRLRSIPALVACYSATFLMTTCLVQTRLMREKVSPTGKYKADLSESETGAVGGWIQIGHDRETHPRVKEVFDPCNGDSTNSHCLSIE